MHKLERSAHRIAGLVILVSIFLLLSSPLIAQQKRAAPPKKAAPKQASQPVPTFDNLIAADSYRIYGELRGVGSFIHSAAVKELLDPMTKMGVPPTEFKAALKWFNAHAEALASSRMLVAGWPARPKLPTILIAIEFSSAEEAQKFEPDLRRFMPTLLPNPTPSPASAPDQPKPKTAAPLNQQKQEDATPPPYQIRHAGSLVLMSDQPFTFRDLAPRGSKLLGEDQNFAMARNRFASEPIFLYVDVKSIEKEDRERTQKAEEEARIRAENEAANLPKEEEAAAAVDSNMSTSAAVISPASTAQPPVQPEELPSAQLSARTQEQISNGATLEPIQPNPLDFAFMSLSSLLFSGQPKWPEAVGAALAFEGDDYVVRTLILNGDEDKSLVIPFIPQFVSGPSLVPASPGIFPADVDLFVALSLDFPQIYQRMTKAFADAEESSRKSGGLRVDASAYATERQPESPFAGYEKQLGLKIKDDILPLFGNEIALVMPKKTIKASTPGESNPVVEPAPAEAEGPLNTVSPEPDPIIAISIKDKDGVKRLIPKIIESLGIKGANLFAQTEKRGDAEITSYAGVFAYAFIGDFLVLSPNAAATRHVVDSFLDHQTLFSDSRFRNSTRWQPRQLVGQFYVRPEMIERYFPLNIGPAGPTNDKLREILSQMNPVVEPLTYAVSNEGLGPFHELHLPKSLLMLLGVGLASQAQDSPLLMNESIAKSLLRTVASGEASFQSTKGDGSYGTLDELLSEGLINKDLLEKYGYKIDVTASSNRFEAVAIPVEYGRTGRISYFIDETGVLRGGDHGGGAATIADKPLE